MKNEIPKQSEDLIGTEAATSLKSAPVIVIPMAEIRRIADLELLHEDTQYDLQNLGKENLWKSAFKLGYLMGQKHVKSSNAV